MSCQIAGYNNQDWDNYANNNVVNNPQPEEQNCYTAQQDDTIHTVQEGDSLWSIIEDMDSTKSNQEILEAIDIVAQANNISDPNIILDGSQIDLSVLKEDTITASSVQNSNNISAVEQTEATTNNTNDTNVTNNTSAAVESSSEIMSKLTYSNTAVATGLDNTPDMQAQQNLEALIANCLQPIEEIAGQSLSITSGYRSPSVNAAVGGVSNSQHMTGQACDFSIPGLTIQETIDLIKAAGIPYDQLINEYDSWVHISFSADGNRYQDFKIA